MSDKIRPGFGTGGIRAIMGEGEEFFDLSLVLEASVGTALWTFNRLSAAALRRGIVVCRDTRLNSEEFARAAAERLSALGFKVFFFEKPSPTPLLSYAVRTYGAACGVSLTASHNPPQYNGFKIYDERGVQLVPDDARALSREIERYRELGDAALAPFEGLPSGEILPIGDELFKEYNSKLLESFPKAEKPEALKAVYSPLFGSGFEPIRDLLSRAGFSSLKLVTEQSAPDGSFPGLKTPNPEDFSALEVAISRARETASPLVFATDPDSDRIAAAELFEGEFLPFSGNELGALLADFALRSLPYDREKKRIVLKTVVTGELGAMIARSRGCEVRETLTGFKFIGELMEKLSDKERFGFAYEESCGYLASGLVRDKDAVSSALLLMLTASECKSRGLSLRERLLELQREHGFFADALESLLLKGESAGYVAALRKMPPFENCETEDYGAGLRSLPKAELLKYTLRDGSTVAVRPSGTEPILKVYYSARGGDENAAKSRLEELKAALRRSLS